MTALAPVIWGTTYLATSELLPPGRPLLAAVVRALPAGLVLVALTRRPPHGGWWWRVVVLGALNIGAYFALLFVGVVAALGAAAVMATGVVVQVAVQRVRQEREVGRWRPAPQGARSRRERDDAAARRIPSRAPAEATPPSAALDGFWRLVTCNDAFAALADVSSRAKNGVVPLGITLT